jgi:hypothetical protein
MADEFFPTSNSLIAGRYAVDVSETYPDVGGGVPAFVARDRLASDGKRVALAVARTLSPRFKHLSSLDEPVDNLMSPLGHGMAPLAGGKGEGYFIICTPPPGPPLSAGLNVWPEKALIDLVLRPVAAVLDLLQSRKLTHRGIRPNNVFQAAAFQPVTLGAAWAAPPAVHQPCVFEMPYSAMCHPASRGDGTIADDVYSLGVLLLTLVGGKIPMNGMDDASVIRWKLDLGSVVALTREVQLSGFFADLLHGMLAEEPDHRPQPAVLMDLARARGRRVAARPGRRSQNALMLNGIPVFDARTLAWGLFCDEKKAIQFLRNGLITQWLRRALGDASLATQIEDLVRGRMNETKPGSWSDPLLVMQTINTLNPRMPLCWRGLALWPEALPSILAEGVANKPEFLMAVEELLAADIFSSWAAARSRPVHPDAPDMALQRQLLQGGGPGALLRLFYGLNPLLPCRLATMAGAWIANIPDLMRFLENTAADIGGSVIDPHLAAFIAARADRKIEMQVTGLAALKDVGAFRTAELALIRDMQVKYHPAPMPALAKWVAGRLQPDLDRWHNRPRRAAMKARLEALAQTGLVARLLDFTEDPAARTADLVGVRQAMKEVAMIDAELTAIDGDDRFRLMNAERYGQAIAGGIGLSALILVAMSVLM